jgi:uncharacterized surface protein with fasciclin (FAS1) repeats
MKNLFKFSAIALATTLAFTSCNDDDDDNNTTPTPLPQEQTIAEIAANDPQFSTLVDILERVDLVNTLNSPGEYTVFAPTNDAFNDALAALGLNSVDELEAALTTDGLRNVVLYHVIGAEVKAAQVTTGFVDMLGTHSSGAALDAYLEASGSSVTINGTSNVAAADVDASNGVIHVVDGVLLPLNIVDLASLSPSHTSLVSTLANTDSDGDGTPGELVTVLSDENATYTVFAPVNEAFDAISSTIATLTDEQIGAVLTYHVVSGANVTADQVTDGPVTTVQTEDITLGTTGGVTVTDVNGGVANVTATDIQGTNGVIHVIDGVLIPTL